ncbi:hypothetical protein [Brazilian marseillevirus]|uniref:hypothetical protein n=1 Tax=Brazilian marseillevirus TaxID=1813599 RepID=UPI0007821B93|nr:hypothetical protein A3303_gp007 [Brazilian marseillevirus]AMQ10515.1 hypothetical protein [Brazilian marseillevirus]
MGDFLKEFMRTLSLCKKKNVLNGLLSLLSKFKRKKGNLWYFEGDSVVFTHKGEQTRETFNDKKLFFRCFEELMSKCRQTCTFEIHCSYSVGTLKENIDKSRSYFATDYEIYWKYLMEEEFFSQNIKHFLYFYLSVTIYFPGVYTSFCEYLPRYIFVTFFAKLFPSPEKPSSFAHFSNSAASNSLLSLKKEKQATPK